MEGLLTRLVGRPRAVLASLACVTALAAWSATGVVLDNDARALVSHEGEETEFLAQHNALFGPDDTTLVVTLTAPAGPTPAVVALTAEISDAIAAIPGVERLDSITATPVLVLRYVLIL
jgi:predicted RND superfamily exporter protein